MLFNEQFREDFEKILLSEEVSRMHRILESGLKSFMKLVLLLLSELSLC